MSPSIKEVWIEISCITFKNEWGKGILCPNFCIQFQPALYTFCTFIIQFHITDLRDGQTWKTPFHPSLFLSAARPQCSNIFSIKIPYPLVASCTNTCVTAPASFPSCMIGEPLTSESSNGQHFLSVFIYDIIASF